MNPEELISLVEELTEKPIRYTPPENGIQKSKEYFLLSRFLNRKIIKINWNEFNEILLICNKDRMSKGFFDFFFRKNSQKKDTLTIGEIKKGVENFRIYAILVFGNFVFAYRKLSKFTEDEIKKELSRLGYLNGPEEIEKEFKSRPAELEKIFPIKREHTHYVGYLSGGIIETEWSSSKILQKFLEQYKTEINESDKELQGYIKANKIKESYADSMKGIITKYINSRRKPTTNGFKTFLRKSFNSIDAVKQEYDKVRREAEINTDIYLTWDYIDVYLATSMREKYEYKAIYDFRQKLFEEPQIKNLKLRWFDPTQSFENNRINKGLIEGLMLKRAKCTIYSVQESDTLGKDSELAATLAQGKPVIAYLPRIQRKSHVDFIKQQSLPFLRDKIDLLWKEFKKHKTQEHCKKWLESKKFNSTIIIDPNSFNRFIFDASNKLSKIWSERIWESIEPTHEEEKKMKEKLGEIFEIISTLFSFAITSKYSICSRASADKSSDEKSAS